MHDAFPSSEVKQKSSFTQRQPFDLPWFNPTLSMLVGAKRLQLWSGTGRSLKLVFYEETKPVTQLPSSSTFLAKEIPFSRGHGKVRGTRITREWREHSLVLTATLGLCIPKIFDYMGYMILFHLLQDWLRALADIRAYYNAILWLRWEFNSNCFWSVKLAKVGTRFPQVLVPLSYWKFWLPVHVFVLFDGISYQIRPSGFHVCTVTS